MERMDVKTLQSDGVMAQEREDGSAGWSENKRGLTLG